MTRPSLLLSFALTILFAWTPSSRAALPKETLDAIAWYDTLGFPDTKGLPYVRVATGAYLQKGNHTPENLFVEGFLVSATPKAFTVFICSVSAFENRFPDFAPYPPLTTVNLVPKSDGPDWRRVGYESLDLKKVSSEVLERVRAHVSNPEMNLSWGQPLAHRARIFAFARACLQNGLPETASELMTIAANVPDEQTGKANPTRFREALQQRIGDSVLVRAEADFRNPLLPWSELLKPYQDFETRFPASKKLAYARESAELLRGMIAEESAHHPKPLDEMSPAEQVAENIYQLRYLAADFWIMNSRYPIDSRNVDGKEVITPVHRLVDLGLESVPQLIAALDDRRFTHSMGFEFHTQDDPVVMRVGDVSQRILEHLSGRNFYPHRRDRGAADDATTRQLAEAWWAEVQRQGEKEALIKVVRAGDQAGYIAAQKLVARFPDAAIDAIKAGMRATTSEGMRGEFVEAAGELPGDAPLAFLRSKLAAGSGIYSQVYAARALFKRNLPEAVPAMIEAWRDVQPRLQTNEANAYDEVGSLIAFLANSGDEKAIEALGHDLRKTPVDVRLALVRMFVPIRDIGGSSWSGLSVDASLGPPDERQPVPEEASAAIERLLVAALDDSARRAEMKLTYNDATYENPRVCDVAAFVLSRRWPAKYHFQWTADATECDAQIVKLRKLSRASD